MFIEMSREQLGLVLRLVEQRVDDLRSEIRRTQNFAYKHELKAEFEEMVSLMHHLHQTECDVIRPEGMVWASLSLPLKRPGCRFSGTLEGGEHSGAFAPQQESNLRELFRQQL